MTSSQVIDFPPILFILHDKFISYLMSVRERGLITLRR